MRVILIQDVDKFGKAGSIIEAKPGFARNFLFPRNLAVPATTANLKGVQQEAKQTANLKQHQREEALNLSNRLNSTSITIAVATHDEDKLYGGISENDIIEALNQEGISEVSKEAVILDKPIKSTGVYDVMVRLHPEVSTKVKVWVVKK